MAKDSDIDPRRCPLCGGPNNCAMAAHQQKQSCWCRETPIPPTLLDKVPAAARNKACICQRCAQTHTSAASN